MAGQFCNGMFAGRPVVSSQDAVLVFRKKKKCDIITVRDTRTRRLSPRTDKMPDSSHQMRGNTLLLSVLMLLLLLCSNAQVLRESVTRNTASAQHEHSSG